ncbi:protein lin-54 homolog isoform X2 [Xenopus tropicalis]|nr:protein lin-54 homolog isoform X2 [Xenopus tropicalis]|eukprot:XP_017948937.1 PREDICTED: protein lin-54 homolog isoform X2 [Xenopus tropicalis]
MQRHSVFSSDQMDGASLCAAGKDTIFLAETNLEEATKHVFSGNPVASWGSKTKKPCNCTRSQCLKLYCDCFANGDLCNNCNCSNCYNNAEHELERFKAVKACLYRNPDAFQPKIEKGKIGDVKPRHNKGCNCKRSGCFKNYCECYEAKIACSSVCKCVGCKNVKSLDSGSIIPTCTSREVIEATCACLLAQAEDAEKEGRSNSLAEQSIIEEFGKCLTQIVHPKV